MFLNQTLHPVTFDFPQNSWHHSSKNVPLVLKNIIFDMFQKVEKGAVHEVNLGLINIINKYRSDTFK